MQLKVLKKSLMKNNVQLFASFGRAVYKVCVACNSKSNSVRAVEQLNTCQHVNVHTWVF